MDDWKKTFSLCDQDGDKLLVLETSSENTVLIAGSVTGIAFELFRSQSTCNVSKWLTIDDETKKFIIRAHPVFTATSQILDTIHACLLNDESHFYWKSTDIAAKR